MRWIFFLGIAAFFVSGLQAEDAAQTERPPEEIIAELDGVIIPRDGGGWMQAKMEGVRLALRFYDAKAKPMPADVERATVRFRPASRNQEFRALAPQDGGMVLSHGRLIRPPHVFKLFISLFQPGNDEAAESYVVNYP